LGKKLTLPERLQELARSVRQLEPRIGQAMKRRAG